MSWSFRTGYGGIAGDFGYPEQLPAHDATCEFRTDGKASENLSSKGSNNKYPTGNLLYTAGEIFNNNGKIDPDYSNHPQQNEAFLFWCHLYLSGIHNFRFKFIDKGTTSNYLSTPPKIGEHVPKSKIAKAMYQVFHREELGNFIILYRQNGTGTVDHPNSTSGAIKPRQAYSILKKKDGAQSADNFLRVFRSGSDFGPEGAFGAHNWNSHGISGRKYLQVNSFAVSDANQDSDIAEDTANNIDAKKVGCITDNDELDLSNNDRVCVLYRSLD